ncbi:hypothetical protein FOIG_10437 [Fusarium odoratissimum NRRL 54006]|uniref:Major facilitator superfamily (MFS) profile domain-containing protein n=1 Tax=Fusarium odoratissimum (strain NRRL 54006) TaxID=1089451 RepID=X0J859_FUSO5|nr:uncharacterized protein FOIG_10437 [Fusarium odoratissimum NRRL 54006]EXL97398.1 hypothetical protein FOIG_10437 [Fusarium odoratissimum NRRL 54006]
MEQLARQMASPPDLSIVQINVKAAPDRIQSLKNWIQNNDLRIDILCLQDIPANIRGIQFSDHILAFGHNNPELIPDMEEEGQGQTKGKKKKPKLKSPYQQKEKLHAVVYLIHKSILVQGWHVEFHDNVNLGLAATLLLRISDDQTIAIHNVHNRFKKVQIPDLLEKVTATGQDLLVGDFNLHHPDWGGDDIRTIDPQAIELSSGLKAADMRILTPRGFKIYSRGKGFAGAYSSTIDLTGASSSPAPFVSNWRSPHVPGFDSDHRVIMTTLDLDIEPVPSTYYLWKLVDPKEFCEFVNNALEHLGFPTLSSPIITNNYARRLVQAFGPAIQNLVPLAPPPGSKRLKNKPTLVTRRAENLLRLAAERTRKTGLMMPSQQHYKTKRLAQNVIRKQRAAAFYRKLSQDIAKRRKLYFWAKAGAKWNQKASMPIRQLKAGNLTHQKPRGQAALATSNKPPDQPAADPERTTLAASQDLTLGDVQELIACAPTGKAAGPDLLAYEGMKMAQKELLPYLHHLFAACLRLGHHPAAFKPASTVMLRKPDKDDYEQPKSWRPVTLLPCMGKLLEKIFTHRVKLLALDDNLLPNMQFGTPGKCTTKALQLLLNNVYAKPTAKEINPGLRCISRHPTGEGLTFNNSANMFPNLSMARAILVVVVISIAALLTALNSQSIVVILPELGNAMAIPSSRQRLVVSIYNISTGSVMLLWGRLADVYGRRLGFLSVSAIFTLSTMFLPWSTYEIPFYVLRAVQGMSAAAIMPSGIGIVASTFAPGPSRNMPFITMSAMASLSSVVGSLLGGFVRTSLAAGFFVTAGHTIRAATQGPTEDIEGSKKPYVDWIGGGLVWSSLTLVLVSITQGNVSGWATPWIPPLLVISVLLLAGFIFYQCRSEKDTYVSTKNFVQILPSFAKRIQWDEARSRPVNVSPA